MKKKTIKRKLFFLCKIRSWYNAGSQLYVYMYNDHTYYVLISVYDIHLL